MDTTTREYTDAELLEAHTLHYAQDHTWAEVADQVGAPSANAMRKAVYRARRRGLFDKAIRQAVAAGQPIPEIVGVPAEEEPDEEEVWRSMTRTWERVKAKEDARSKQRIDFSKTDLPVCIAYLADLHLGGSGVDYPQIDADMNTIDGTPGMFAAIVGDVVDNFLYSWAMKIRMGTEHTIPDEWAAARRVLRSLGPNLLAAQSGNHDCHDEQTECLTRRGWLFYNELRDSDEILSYIPETGECEWTKINERVVYDYDGPMVRLQSLTVDALVTPNHRILQSRRPGGEWQDWEYRHAEDTTGRIRLPVSAQVKATGADLTDDQIEFAAWILTDGYIGNRKASQTPRMAIYQSKEWKPIKDLLDRLGYSYRHNVREREIAEVCGKALLAPPLPHHEFTLHAASTADALTYIDDSNNLPTWVARLDARQAQLFLNTLMAGDGSWATGREGKTGILYKREAFLDQVQAFVIQHGWRGKISCARESDWRLSLHKKDTIEFDTRKVKSTEDYSGKVWCLRVPRGNFMVRRNGCAHFSGNSWTTNVAGIDYFREVVAGTAPDVLYDRDEIVFDLLVGSEAKYRVKMRHIWQGNSIYNQTHAIERAVRFDCPDVDHGIAAHTHHAGLSRPFHVGGKLKLATQCGAYKRVDAFQRERGFYKSNEQVAQAVMYTPDGIMQEFQTLDLAAQHMAIYYGRVEV